MMTEISCKESELLHILRTLLRMSFAEYNLSCTKGWDGWWH
jgi:hypothetical protein